MIDEDKIVEEAEIVLEDEYDFSDPVDITGGVGIDAIKNFKPNTGPNALPNDLVCRARAMYIANNMSLKEVSSALGCNLRTLQRYCAEQKWTIFKNNPNMLTYTEELFAEIYQNLNFYDLAREICSKLATMEIYQNPKDLKTIVEAFKIADERSTQLRIVGASAKGETGSETLIGEEDTD